MVEPDSVLDNDHRESMAVRLGISHYSSAYPNPVKATQPVRYLPKRVLGMISSWCS